MTTAKYYTPSHRTIHENGVTPNIVATLTPGQEETLARWFRRDSASPAEKKKLESFRDPQLTRAVDAMKGALVYSGTEAGGAKKDPKPAAGKQMAKGEKVPFEKPADDKKSAEKPTSQAPAKGETEPASAVE